MRQKGWPDPATTRHFCSDKNYLWRCSNDTLRWSKSTSISTQVILRVSKLHSRVKESLRRSIHLIERSANRIDNRIHILNILRPERTIWIPRFWIIQKDDTASLRGVSSSKASLLWLQQTRHTRGWFPCKAWSSVSVDHRQKRETDPLLNRNSIMQFPVTRIRRSLLILIPSHALRSCLFQRWSRQAFSDGFPEGTLSGYRQAAEEARRVESFFHSVIH